MILIENYLVQMGRYLPEKGAADIVDELRGSLEEQVCDLAEAEHREPTSDDEYTVLRQLGHPMEYAASFKSHQYLIGPSLFPTYSHVLKVALVAVLCIQLVMNLLVTLLQEREIQIFHLFAGLWDTAFFLVTVVTCIFFAIEYSGNKLNWFSDWDPKNLSTRSVCTVDNSDMFTNLVTEGVALLLWNGVLGIWTPFNYNFHSYMEFTSFEQVFWPVNIVFGASFILHGYLLMRGYWNQMFLAFELVLIFTLILIIGYIFANPPIVTSSVASEATSAVWAQRGIVAIALFILIVCLADFWKHFRMMRDMRNVHSVNS